MADLDVALDDLVLDIANVRLAIDGLDEAGIANYLVESEDLINLARDILRDGYIDNEMPIVVDEDGDYVVLEANRRVAALKAIHNPQMLGRHAAALQRHLSRYPANDIPKVIRVQFAPSREAVQPVLARLHTGQPKRSWIREQQAVFYHAQLSQSVGVDELRTQYPREAGKILEFIRMGEMRDLIRGLRYDDSDLEEFVKTNRLKMSSLEYAYERPRIREVLGLRFSNEGLLENKRLSDGQRRGLMHLLAKFKDGTLNTRSAALKQSRDEHEALVEELAAIVSGGVTGQSGTTDASSSAAGGSGTNAGANTAGGGGPGGSGGSHSSAGGTGASAGQGRTGPSGPQPDGRGPNRGDTRAQLDFTGFVYQGSGLAGLRRRFEELRRINVREYPNASHDLIRTVLECSIKDYFDNKGQSLQGRTTLGPSVTALAAEFQGNQNMTTLINNINRSGRMPTSQYSGTADSLNATNHNPAAFASHTDVHEAWDRIKPILIEIVG